jgi:hypothetical protein
MEDDKNSKKVAKYKNAEPNYLLYLAEVSYRHYRFDDTLLFFEMALEKNININNCK